MFWKKKNDKIIQCSVCEWQPDGAEHWSCSCGHLLNTFKTKGKCPKCNTQWEDTWCPGCGKTTPHQSWYKTREEIKELNAKADQRLRAKKLRLEARLIDYGITNHRVAFLPWLDHEKESFQSPYEAGCRMMILYAIGYLVSHLEERPQMMDWLKEERIWNKVSPREKEFFTDPAPDDNSLMNMSWKIEGALTLGWCLKKIKRLPSIENESDEKTLAKFQNNVPGLGEALSLFLTKLEYRDLGEIYEENLLNEIATTYFRDLLFNGQKDQTKINRMTSLERHVVLNWLRQFMGIEDWDETSTAT